MAIKKLSSTSANGSTAPLKLCYERIIPAELDPTRPIRHSFRSALSSMQNDMLHASDPVMISKIALIYAKRWQPGQILRCRFLHGDAAVKKKVEAIAHEWEKYANLKFKFVQTGEAEIRIAFANDGSWSAVGRDALNTQYFPKHQPTMNYGWLDATTSDAEYHRVVLHEFGHAIGCIHEHQAPKFNRVWDKNKVIAYFSGSPNYWSVEDIDNNVLKKYSPQGIVSTEYDPDSIMLYMFDGKLFADNKGPTNDNRKLSAKDIAFIKKLYPKP